jgi:hypothetical protein
LWKSIEAKAKSIGIVGEKPPLVTMVGVNKMASFLGFRKCGEGMVDAMKADALPQNPDLANAIVANKVRNIDEKKKKDIKDLFNGRTNWNRNLKKRRSVVKEVVQWHNNLSIISM